VGERHTPVVGAVVSADNQRASGSVPDLLDLAGLVLDLLIDLFPKDLESGNGDERDDANEDDVFDEVCAGVITEELVDLDHHGVVSLGR